MYRELSGTLPEARTQIMFHPGLQHFGTGSVELDRSCGFVLADDTSGIWKPGPYWTSKLGSRCWRHVALPPTLTVRENLSPWSGIETRLLGRKGILAVPQPPRYTYNPLVQNIAQAIAVSQLLREARP